jgi:hypothetical protein
MSQRQDVVPVEVSYARAFYKHALITAAIALVMFAVVGSVAVVATYSTTDAPAAAFAVVAFLAWGMIGAAIVLASRKPPF